MKPVDVGSNAYIDFDEKHNNEHPKFKVGEHERIIKCFFQKVTFEIGLRKFLKLK